MSLTSTIKILKNAREQKYAVGAFEVWDMASVQAVLGVAEALHMPVILQLGPIEIDYIGIQDISDYIRNKAYRTSVPVALHLDHGESFERVMQCIHAGFTSVMYDVSHLPFEENVKITQEVVRVAHAAGVSVEGELGRIGGEESGIDVNRDDSLLTDPRMAAEFVERTGIDSLAVAIGTVHGVYKEAPNIRLNLLREIASAVSIPLVLHGGSGTPDSIIREAIGAGICKINICTEFVTAFADSFVRQHKEPGFKYNVPGVFMLPRESAKKVIKNKMELFSGPAAFQANTMKQ